jgi:hypothetical protein
MGKKSSDIWWKTASLAFDGKCQQFIEKFWCQRKKNSPTPPPLAGSQTPFWKIQYQRTRNYSTEPEKWEEETKRKIIKMRKGQRKWHIFVLTGGFCCYFT